MEDGKDYCAVCVWCRDEGGGWRYCSMEPSTLDEAIRDAEILRKKIGAITAHVMHAHVFAGLVLAGFDFSFSGAMQYEVVLPRDAVVGRVSEGGKWEPLSENPKAVLVHVCDDSFTLEQLAALP